MAKAEDEGGGMGDMSYYSDQLERKSADILNSYINVRQSYTTVPDVADIKLEKNEGVLVDATYVYCDMDGSTKLAQSIKKPVVAKILRSYLNGATSILARYGGAIRGFDGDRVLAVFIGDDKETKAVRAALAVNWLVHGYLREKINETWTDIAQHWNLNHGVGVDSGEALITRTGIRGDNDLISCGSAPNTAAKLTETGTGIYITKEVYEPMSNDVAFSDGGQPMWSGPMFKTIGNRVFTVYSSFWHWAPA